MDVIGANLTSVQAVVQYGAVAVLLGVIIALQRGILVPGKVYSDALAALQKAKAESETQWRDRYEELRLDRDRYRDIALQNAMLVTRSNEVTRHVLGEGSR